MKSCFSIDRSIKASVKHKTRTAVCVPEIAEIFAGDGLHRGAGGAKSALEF